MRGRFLGALLILIGTVGLLPAQAAELGWAQLAMIDRDRALWLADVDGGRAVRIETGLTVTGVAWSPEGGRLAFAGLQDSRTMVGLVVTTRPPVVRLLGTGTAPAWSDDGRWLAWIDGEDVVLATREGDVVRRVGVGVSRLTWSPDGRWLGFVRPTGEPDYGSCPVTEFGWIDVTTGAITVIGRTIGEIGWIGASGNAERPRLLASGADDARVWWMEPGSRERGLLWDGFAELCRGPLLTSRDGQWVGFLDAVGGGDDLILLNLVTGEHRRVTDLPLGYPGYQLPRVYLWLDPLARFVYASRSFPTVVTRIDLVTGARTVAASDDGILVGIGPEGEQLAFVRNTPGKPPVLVVVEPASGRQQVLERMGWAAWEPAACAPIAFRAIQRTWEREDRLVAASAVSRSWVWGPAPLLVTTEPYQDAPGGRRLVVYWDKARMEVTTLSGDRGSRWYVTNGLLVRELITGQVQVGDALFERREPATIPVAGDLDDPIGPTYATFQLLLSVPPLTVGSEVRWRVHRDGSVTDDGPGGVRVAVWIPETNHTIADVFWTFLQSEGMIWEEGAPRAGALFEPIFFATGLPITEPYWATVKVGGRSQDVLVQCFERRCLTYTPANPPGWQVEMGNVGRHYLAWRYGR